MKSKMKTKKLLAAFVLTGALIAGCMKDEYPEIVGVCPAVESTNPADKAMGVPLSQVITVTFNEEINPATLTATSFTIQGLSPVAGTISYSNKTASFTPANPLAANVTYTGTITTSVKDMMGNAIQENYVWTFSTDATPSVSFTSPFVNEGGVLLNKVLTVQFNMAMNPSTLNETTFILMRGTVPVTGAASYNGTNLIFTPAGNLLSETEYTATVTAGAKSLAGMPMAADYVWKFSTGQIPTVILTDPLNNATSVSTDKIVSAKFNMAMDPLSLLGTTFTLKQGATSILGTVTYNGSDIFFIPSGNLMPGVEYTATINTNARNVAGIAMASDYEWKFTTAVTVAPSVPTVTSTSPLNLETGVLVKKIVTARFSLLMDPLTLNGSTFTLFRGTTQVAGTITYNGEDVSFIPTGDLMPGTEYTATIKTGAKSIAGVPLAADYIWKFTTVNPVAPTIIATNPINLTTGVVLNKVVTATFSVPMDASTIIGTNFTLAKGTTAVTGVVTYANSVAYFTPSADLLPDTEYTATVTNSVKNVAGTSMLNNYVWKFTTKAVVVEPLFSSIFGSFGGNAGVTNQGIYTVINNGSIGTTAASTLVTGFHDSTGDVYEETPLNIGNVKGRIYTDGPPPVIFAAGGPFGGNATTMAKAQEGLLAARNFYTSISPANKPGGITLDTDELGGRTLAPGIYKSGSSYSITTVDLTLDAQGDANAVWIFQVPSALTVGTPTGARSIVLINGAQAKNVYWYVGTSAVINYAGGGIMAGTIIAELGVTLSSPGNSTNTTVQTVLNGRAISLVSSVTMVNTIINVPQ
jgi:hypothetical protein